MDKKRSLEHKFNELLKMFPVVAVIGPRQCGKSTFVKNMRSDWRYYDLEAPDDYQLITSDPVRFFQLNSENIIIDEAQNFPALFNSLRGVIDNKRGQKGRFILTVSSSPELVKGLNESLAGRMATIEMSPFKTNEYCEKKISPLYQMLTQGEHDIRSFQNLKTELALEDSFKVWYKGGFPEPLIEGENQLEFHKVWMEHYLTSYLQRDIRGLFPKIDLHNYRTFLTLLAQFSGHQLNMAEMARALEVSVPTIKSYLEIIHQTFLWRNLDPFEKNTLKKVQKSKKGFFRDQGILHYFFKIPSLNDLLIHPIAGFSFESFVIEELIRGFKTQLTTQIDFTYYRTIDKSEVDLVIDGPFGIIPIEVKLNSNLNPRKNLRGLEQLMADLKLKLGIVINTGKRIELLSDAIVQIPVHYL